MTSPQPKRLRTHRGFYVIVVFAFLFGAMVGAHSLSLREFFRPSQAGWRIADYQSMWPRDPELDPDRVVLLQMTSNSNVQISNNELSFRRQLTSGGDLPIYQVGAHPPFGPLPKWQHFLSAPSRDSIVRMEESNEDDWTVFVDDSPEIEFRRERETIETRPGFYNHTETWHIIHRIRGKSMIVQNKESNQTVEATASGAPHL